MSSSGPSPLEHLRHLNPGTKPDFVVKSRIGKGITPAHTTPDARTEWVKYMSMCSCCGDGGDKATDVAKLFLTRASLMSKANLCLKKRRERGLITVFRQTEDTCLPALALCGSWKPS